MCATYVCTTTAGVAPGYVHARHPVACLLCVTIRSQFVHVRPAAASMPTGNVGNAYALNAINLLNSIGHMSAIRQDIHSC